MTDAGLCLSSALLEFRVVAKGTLMNYLFGWCLARVLVDAQRDEGRAGLWPVLPAALNDAPFALALPGGLTP